MRKGFYILIIFLAGMFTSCETRKDAIDFSNDPGAIRVDVRIKSAYTKSNPLTGMGDPLSFNSGDCVFVSSEDGTVVYQYKSGKWNPTDNYFFRWGSEGQSFHASYPATDGSDYLNFTLPSNQSTHEKLSNADYMVCNIDAIHNDGTGVLRFDMDRRLAKVVYTLSSVGESEAVKGFKINSPIGIEHGEASDETIMVTPFVVVPEGGIRGGNGTQYVALVVPSEEMTGQDQVSMVYKNSQLIFRAIPHRQAGKQYEYQIKVEGDKVTIMDPVVSDWTEGTIVGGNATPNRRFHWFVKPDGTGEGTSWEDALGPYKVRELLATAENNGEAAALYDKTQFHFAGGEYDLSDTDGAVLKIEYTGYSLPVNISWDGGYNPASTGTSLSDRNASSYQTVLSGAGSHPILQLGNQTSMSFDGLVFSDAFSSGKGAALYQAPGSSGTSEIEMVNCCFISNKGSSGSAICSNKGTISCTDCIFSNNESTGNGGAIAFAGSALTLNSCSFNNNVSGNTSHTVSDSSDGKGGAIWLHGSTAPIATLTSCVFSGNRAGVAENTDSKEYGGAIAMKTADLTAVLCEFTESKGNRGSALMMLSGGGGLFKADRCSFHDNFQYSRGVCYILSQNVAMFNQCSFYSQELRGVSGVWGEQMHGGGDTGICINNCSFNSTKTSYTKQVAGLNTNGWLLLTNSTVIGKYPSNDGGVVRMGVEQSRLSMANSVVVNRSVSDVSVLQKGTSLYSGYNAVGAVNTSFTGTVVDPQLFIWSAYAGENENWKNWFACDDLQGFTKGTVNDVVAAFDAFDLDVKGWKGALSGMSNVGETFKQWLELSTPAAYSVNQRGESRSEQFWPGAYQE